MTGGEWSRGPRGGIDADAQHVDIGVEQAQQVALPGHDAHRQVVRPRIERAQIVERDGDIGEAASALAGYGADLIAAHENRIARRQNMLPTARKSTRLNSSQSCASRMPSSTCN